MADLSPAAQAVLDACDRAIDREMTSLAFDPFREPLTRDIAAAALRALADHQQAPVTLGQPIDHWDPDDRTRRELRNLADELEVADGQ